MEIVIEHASHIRPRPRPRPRHNRQSSNSLNRQIYIHMIRRTRPLALRQSTHDPVPRWDYAFNPVRVGSSRMLHPIIIDIILLFITFILRPQLYPHIQPQPIVLTPSLLPASASRTSGDTDHTPSPAPTPFSSFTSQIVPLSFLGG